MSQFQENLRTHGRTNRKTDRMDGQTLFYRTLLAKHRGPINILNDRGDE